MQSHRILSPGQNQFVHLLIVDDKLMTMRGISSELRRSGLWRVEEVSTPTEAIDMLETLEKRNDLPDVVSVDLGLADLPNEPQYGLSLLKRIRSTWDGLNLVVHSGLDVDEALVREVMQHRASYCHLVSAHEAQLYLQVLPFIAQGCLILSPTPAVQLHNYFSAAPDPFANNVELWGTLELMALGRTYTQIAKAEHVQPGTIKKRVQRLVTTLETLGEFEDQEEENERRHRQRLIRWYHQNSFRRIQ
ncbi:MAG: response regulator [Anaerolineae bacterium]|nr:response regulator [Anaerolineae bacterium]